MRSSFGRRRNLVSLLAFCTNRSFGEKNGSRRTHLSQRPWKKLVKDTKEKGETGSCLPHFHINYHLKMIYAPLEITDIYYSLYYRIFLILSKFVEMLLFIRKRKKKERKEHTCSTRLVLGISRNTLTVLILPKSN